MKSDLNKIFLTQLKGIKKIVVILFFFIITISPRIFQIIISSNFNIGHILNYTVITTILVLTTHFLLQKFKNVNYVILTTVILCTTSRLIYELIVGNGFYAGVIMTAVYVLTLLYLWSRFSSSKIYYPIILILGLAFAEITMTLSRLGYYWILDGVPLNSASIIIRNLFRIIYTEFFHAILVVGLFFAFGIFKFIKTPK